MSTKISWCDETWNPICGCSKISAGCKNCFAERMAARQVWMEIQRTKPGNIVGDTLGGKRPYNDVIGVNGKWNGKTVFRHSQLTKPLHWRNPRKIFVCSMSDLWHESIPFEWIDRVFAIMALCPQHQFMCLTKRVGRMREYMVDIRTPIRIAGAASQGARTTIDLGRFWGEAGWPPKNVHLGVTVENQDNMGRVDDLVRTPATKRFISIEPMLEDIAFPKRRLEHIDYVYLGCESKGPPERLCTLDDMMHQMKRCWRAGVKVHVKQIPLNGKCNKNFKEWPPEFQVREI